VKEWYFFYQKDHKYRKKGKLGHRGRLVVPSSIGVAMLDLEESDLERVCTRDRGEK
jgi:hypothetical protein